MSDSAAYRRFILILGAVVALGPLTIDMYLPSLPAIGRALAADAGSVQLTVSGYFAGLAVGQLIYGPVSDRYGRKIPLMFGLAVYTLASIGCALAPDVHTLVALRVLQALGGCAGMVISRALVRDRFAVDEMARVLSALVLVMGLAPILAPTLGGLIFLHFGWQAIFLLLAASGAFCLLLVGFGIREQLRERMAELSLASVGRGYLQILGHRQFIRYALAGGSAQAGMFTYITASPFVFIDYFGLAPDRYGLLFGVNAFGLIAASYFNGRLLRRVHAERVLRGALLTYLGAGLCMLAAAVTGFAGFWGIAVPLVVGITSLGFTFPNAQAAAMAPFGNRAGMASATLGTLQFVLAGAFSSLVAQLHSGDARGMAATIAICGLIANLVLRRQPFGSSDRSLA